MTQRIPEASAPVNSAAVKKKQPPPEPFAVYENARPWTTDAYTHRQAAIKYAERHYGTVDGLRDELVLVVIRVSDGMRRACLLRSKVMVQWTAPQVEEVPSAPAKDAEATR